MLTVKLQHAFRRTYILALALTAVIGLVAFVVHSRTAEAQNVTMQQIDLSLTVRTNMHSIAFLGSRLPLITSEAEREAIRREMRQAIKAMSGTYKQLFSGAQSPAILDIHLNPPYELTHKIATFLDAANTLTQAGLIATDTPAYQQIIALRPALLDTLNFLADQYRLDEQALSQQHRGTELTLLILMLVTLVLEVAFIFRPMERHIMTTQTELQAEVKRSQITATALSNSESRYRQMFENHPTVKLLINPKDGRIIEANPAASAFYGYPLEQLKSMTVFDINVRSKAFVTAARDQLLVTPNAIFQGHHLLASGKTRYVEVSAGVLVIDDQQLIYAIVQDVSKRKQVEDALRESDVRYRALFEQTSDGVFIIDLAGKLLTMNQSALDMVGYERDEIEQYPITQLSAESTESLHILERLLAGERVPVYERLFRRKNGEVFPVEINASLVRTSDGEPLHIQTIVRDISQRNQAEQALRDNEILYRTLVQNMPATGVIMFDTDMRYTLAEGPFLKSLNTNWDTLIGKRPQEVLAPEVLDFILPINERVLKGEAFSYERVTAEFAYYAHARPLRDEAGQITGGMILQHDITALKRTEQALRANEQHLRLITDSIQDVVTQTDANNVITFASSSYRSMLGYEPASLLGRSGSQLVYPEDLPRYSQILEEAMTTPDHPIVIEGRLIHQQGHVIWTETLGKLVFDEQGQHIGAVYVTREITERKRLEQALLEQEKLRMALEKEQELSTLKTRMMEVISHEFRTPLAVIQLTMGTLIDYFERISPEQRVAKFSTVSERIQRITEMLNDLDIIVRGGFMPEMVQRSPVDLAAMCRTTAAQLETEYPAAGKFSLELTAPAMVNADSIVLNNAVKNILSNAARFSRPDGVVKVSLTASDQGFDLIVTDSGIGIPAADQARLFQPFFRGSNIGTIGGLGLGLTIARAAIEAHQGTISVESVPDQGTTVRLWVPISSARQVAK